MNDVPYRPPAAAAPPGYPADLERDWQTADGTVVHLRPLRPDDLESELKFIAGLSEQTPMTARGSGTPFHQQVESLRTKLVRPR